MWPGRKATQKKRSCSKKAPQVDFSSLRIENLVIPEDTVEFTLQEVETGNLPSRGHAPHVYSHHFARLQIARSEIQAAEAHADPPHDGDGLLALGHRKFGEEGPCHGSLHLPPGGTLGFQFQTLSVAHGDHPQARGSAGMVGTAVAHAVTGRKPARMDNAGFELPRPLEIPEAGQTQ